MAGANILHVGAVRVRALGVGSLGITLNSFQNINVSTLSAIVLSTTIAYKYDRLGNVVGQGIKWGMFQGGALTDTCRVSDVTVYIKEQWTQVPQIVHG